MGLFPAQRSLMGPFPKRETVKVQISWRKECFTALITLQNTVNRLPRGAFHTTFLGTFQKCLANKEWKYKNVAF